MVGIGRWLTRSSRSGGVSSGLSRHDRCVWTRPRFSQNGRGEIGSRRCAKFATASSVNAKFEAKQRKKVCDEDGGEGGLAGDLLEPRLDFFEVGLSTLWKSLKSRSKNLSTSIQYLVISTFWCQYVRRSRQHTKHPAPFSFPARFKFISSAVFGIVPLFPKFL
jgi:hypothetical protein